MARFAAARDAARVDPRPARVPRARAPGPCSRGSPPTRCCASARPLTASFGLVLGMLAHAVGWPVARGGSGRIADGPRGGGPRRWACEIETGRRVDALADLPRRAGGPPRPHAAPGRRDRRRPAPIGLPPAARALPLRPGRVQGRLGARRADPVADPRHRARAATVHLGGSLREVAASEDAVAQGGMSERPFVLLVQPTIADPSRAPAGKHTAWAYCHVPNGSTLDMTAAIEAQVERFAPGFRDLVLARATRDARGDGGVRRELRRRRHQRRHPGLRQLFFRPVARRNPYTTPDPGAVPVLVVDAAGRRGPRACAASTPRARRSDGCAGRDAPAGGVGFDPSRHRDDACDPGAGRDDRPRRRGGRRAPPLVRRPRPRARCATSRTADRLALAR